jgi:hypothetical protein
MAYLAYVARKSDQKANLSVVSGPLSVAFSDNHRGKKGLAAKRRKNRKKESNQTAGFFSHGGHEGRKEGGQFPRRFGDDRRWAGQAEHPTSNIERRILKHRGNAQRLDGVLNRRISGFHPLSDSPAQVQTFSSMR